MKTTAEILADRSLPIIRYYLIGDYLIKEENEKFYIKEMIDVDVQLELECNFSDAPMIKEITKDWVVLN